MKLRVLTILMAVITALAFSSIGSFAEENDILETSDDITVTCDKVTGVKAKGISQSSIKVTWNKVSGASGYQVYRWNGKKQKYILQKTLSSSKLSYTDKGLKANRYKTYRIKAYVLDGEDRVYGSMSKSAKALTKPRTLRVKAWAYTGKGRTAIGKKVKKGYIAVDPNVIKLRTKVYIPGYGKAVAADTGGAIKGNIIDVYLNSEKACRNWGVRYVTIKIYD